MSEKKVNVPQEIKDDELDVVAGGAYSEAEWLKMTKEERTAAVIRSAKAKQANQPCELD